MVYVLCLNIAGVREDMPIKWRLAVLMADREVNHKQLAEMTGMHYVTIPLAQKHAGYARKVRE
jgi:DNA-binding Xre family transcriptional regulator